MTQMMDPNELTAPDQYTPENGYVWPKWGFLQEDPTHARSILILDDQGKPLFYDSRARVRRLNDGSIEIVGSDPVED